MWENEGPTVEIKRALVFAILMQNIKGKAPSYVMEKWASVNMWGKDDIELIFQLLDAPNRTVLRRYLEEWSIKDWEIGDW